MRITPVVVIITLATCCAAQTWTRDSLIDHQSGSKVVADKQHNWYLFSRDSSFVSKFHSSGVLAFKKNIPGLAISQVVATSDLGFCIAGNFTNTAGSGTNVLQATGPGFALVKYDAAGNLMWTRIGTSNGGAWIEDICARGTDLVFTGATADTLFMQQATLPGTGNKEMYIMALSQAGSLLDFVIAKSDSLGGSTSASPGSHGIELESDISGSIYVLAYLQGNLHIDTALAAWSNGGPYSYRWLLKLDNQLNFVWGSEIGMIAYSKEHYHNLRVNSLAEAFMIVDMGSQYGGDHSRIDKWDPAGQRKMLHFSLGLNEWQYWWHRWFKDLQIDSCNSLYVTGSAEGTYQPSGREQHYLLHAQLTSAGQVLWKRLDSASTQRSGTGLSLLGPNYMIVTGYFRDSLTLQNKMASNYTLSVWNGTYAMGNFHATLQTTVGVPGIITPAAARVVCEQENAILTATANAPVNWYLSQVSGIPQWVGHTYTTSPLSAGVHTFYAEANSCTLTAGRVPVTVTVNPNPPLNVSNGLICRGDTFLISPTGAASYTVSSGSVFVSPTITTLYYITGSSHQGCTVGVVIQVSVVPPPMVIIQSNLNYVCAGEQVILTAGGVSSYTWSNGVNSPTLTVIPNSTTVFSVTGEDSYGCTNTATIVQHVAECLGLEETGIPVSVSPNPASDHITVTIPFDGEITISDLGGKILYSRHVDAGATEIRRDDLAQGCYLLRVKGQEKQKVFRIIYN